MDNKFAERLKHHMRLQGLSGYRLAQDSGRSEATISLLLSGRRSPSPAMVRDLARPLGAPADELLEAAGFLKYPSMAGERSAASTEELTSTLLASQDGTGGEFLMLRREIAHLLPDLEQFRAQSAGDRKVVIRHMRSVLFQIQTLGMIGSQVKKSKGELTSAQPASNRAC